MPSQDPYRVPERLRARFDRIVERTDAIATEHLNGEYADFARRMAAALARKRPSPLESGQPRTWAAGILYAVGWVNFLSDPTQDPHMTTVELADRAGVGQSTIAAQFGKIRHALNLRRFDPEWTLPGKLADNPLVWILKVNGLLVDIRSMPREAQVAAFDAGLIPFIPADGLPRTRQASAPTGDAREQDAPGGERVYQLKITLENVRPAIWRRVLVPEDTTLAGLHRVVQAAMGWEDYHLWRFEIGDVEYAEPSEEEWRPTEDARQARLGQVAGPGSVLRYVYDFGDDWEHRIRVEKVLPAEPGREYPVCVAAERAGPPEDSGGPFGYERLLRVLADPADPEHDDMVEWAGEDLDPETVDLDEINSRLALTRPRESEGGWAPDPTAGATGGVGDGPGSSLASLHHRAEAMVRQAGEVLERFLADNPDAGPEEVSAALRSAGFDVVSSTEPEFGGLSPTQVQRLLDGEWERSDSAVRLDATLSLEDLAGSRTLHNARLLLELLGAEGEVKATPKGNLPRAFVARFRERMRAPEDRWALPEPRVLNEEDVWLLHVVRLLLELAGLVKRRKGLFSLTRTGQRLAAEARAGELFATLFRVHFRRFNLGYLDNAPDVPEFQFSIAYSLFRFGQLGGDWMDRYDLAESIVLPGVGEGLTPDPMYNPLPAIVESRLLRPLEGFGLAEVQEIERAPGELGARKAFRKAPLYDRFLCFRLSGA